MPNFPEWHDNPMLRRLVALEKQVAVLSHGRSPLRHGAMSDQTTGKVRMRTGHLPDGSFGIAFYDDDGNMIVKLDENGLRMYDSAETLRARVGLINDEVGYGVSVFDDAGGLRFEVNNDGYRDPWFAYPMIPASAFLTTTSSTFEPIYQGQVDLVTHEGVSCAVVATCPAGTTGEIRLTRASGTPDSTDAVAIADGGQVSQSFQWLHGADLGTGPVRFDVEARRTGGSGNVNIFQPYAFSMADPLQCTASGL